VSEHQAGVNGEHLMGLCPFSIGLSQEGIPGSNHTPLCAFGVGVS